MHLSINTWTRILPLYAGILTINIACNIGALLPVTASKYQDFFARCHNRFSRKFTGGNLEVEVTYCPPQVFAARELAFDTTRTVGQVLPGYENSLSFFVSVHTRGTVVSSPLVLGNREPGCSDATLRNTFGTEHDFCIACGSDTVFSVGHTFDRSWGVSEGDTHVITFRRQDIKGPYGKCHLIIRNIDADIGTIDVDLASIVKPAPGIKG